MESKPNFQILLSVKLLDPYHRIKLQLRSKLKINNTQVLSTYINVPHTLQKYVVILYITSLIVLIP